MDLTEIIPEGFKDKEYMKNVKDVPDLFNQFDNLQKFRGSAIRVPDTEASDDEWAKVYAKLGRPESPEEYGIEIPEGDSATKEVMDKVMQDFHKIGLTKKQAEQVYNSYSGILTEVAERENKKTEEQQKAILEKANSYFGANKEKAIEVSDKLLRDNLPEEMNELAESMDEESQLLFAAVLNKINDTYIAEDKAANIKGDTSQIGAATSEELHKEILEERQNEAYRDKFHPEHKKQRDKITKMYEKLVKLREKENQ